MKKGLNCYAGLGGNRTYWKGYKITAIENNPDIARIYQRRFPDDKVIVADAHEYLRKHYNEYDFIWSSPPCQTHSSFRYNICVRFRGTEPLYPDMRLWQEILFLHHHAKCRWVVENVNPYYKFDMEVKPQKIQRHLFWANFKIRNIEIPTEKIRTSQIPQLQKIHEIDLSNVKIKNKRQILRNCVHPKLGKHIFEEMKNNDQ